MSREFEQFRDEVPNSVVENWGKPGMPALFVRVLDKEVLHETEAGGWRLERVIVKGDFPHWGQVVDGWTGKETIIERSVVKGKHDHIYRK